MAKHLIAGLLHAESLGFTVEGGEASIRELLDKFAVLSEMKGGDVDHVRKKHNRPSLEYLSEIDEQVKKDLPGAPLDGPAAIALHHYYVRNGLPYEQEQG